MFDKKELSRSQMMVRIEDMHAPKFPLKCVSLVELYKSGKLKFRTASSIEFHLSFAAPKAHGPSDLQVSLGGKSAAVASDGRPKVDF